MTPRSGALDRAAVPSAAPAELDELSKLHEQLLLAAGKGENEKLAQLKRRDAKKARSLMAQHIRNSGEKLAEYVDKRQRLDA